MNKGWYCKCRRWVQWYIFRLSEWDILKYEMKNGPKPTPEQERKSQKEFEEAMARLTSPDWDNILTQGEWPTVVEQGRFLRFRKTKGNEVTKLTAEEMRRLENKFAGIKE